MKFIFMIFFMLASGLVYSDNVRKKEFDYKDANILEVSKKDDSFAYILDGKTDSYDKCLEIIKKDCLRRSNSNKYSLCSIVLDKSMTSEDILKLIKDLIGCGVEKLEILIINNLESRVSLMLDKDPMPIFIKKEEPEPLQEIDNKTKEE